MTRFVFLFAWLFAAAAAAQDVGTTFTLGTPTANCIPLATQDGVSTNGQGAVCPNGFYGGGSLQISLPNDPVNPGNSVDMYACTATVISNTVPPSGTKTPSPPGALVQSVSCPVEYSYFSTTWTGTLTYNYVSVLQRHCSSGRGAHCVTAYYAVWSGGGGTFSTPAPPPPPPQPVVTVLTLNLQAAPCDAALVCELLPTDQTSVTTAMIDIPNAALTVAFADGSTETSPLDSAQPVPNGDDGDAFTVYASGTLYDQNGNSNQTVDAQFSIRSNDGGNYDVTSGTLTITTTTGP